MSSQVFDRRVFYPGQRVFNQGDPGHCMYFVESGRVLIARTRPVPRSGQQPTLADHFCLRAHEGSLWLDAADGQTLHVLRATLNGQWIDATSGPSELGFTTLHPLS